MIRVNNIKAPLEATLDDLHLLVEKKLQTPLNIHDMQLCKKSIDARNKNNIHNIYSINCNVEIDNLTDKDIEKITPLPELKFNIPRLPLRPVVVGSGPAGMFAALALAEAGLNPIIIERGDDVETRHKKINNFWKNQKLDTESNVQFGEGGAGTFSDGKLMSGIKKDMFTHKVMQEFYLAGAPQEILYLSKPHIGTDNLQKVVRNIRRKIENLGGEYRFATKLEKLLIQNEKIIGIEVSCNQKKNIITTNHVFLAIGHSARDTFEMLYKSGVHIEQKPFAIGARIEHPQILINKAQFGKQYNNPLLGAADYKMAVHFANGRSAYTFCMCPGGMVVAAASESGGVVTNGMSEFARDQKNANAALLVDVNKKDFGSNHPLAGMYFQRQLEQKAFIEGGRNYKAPAQLVGDFLQKKKSVRLGDVTPSYLPGIQLSNLNTILPTEITDTMRYGITKMAQKLHGFDQYDAILTGVETRSSSPIRIIRDQSMQSNIKGLYPCGEGAGYAGGITSSAADGLKVVYSLSQT